MTDQYNSYVGAVEQSDGHIPQACSVTANAERKVSRRSELGDLSAHVKGLTGISPPAGTAPASATGQNCDCNNGACSKCYTGPVNETNEPASALDTTYGGSARAVTEQRSSKTMSYADLLVHAAGLDKQLTEARRENVRWENAHKIILAENERLKRDLVQTKTAWDSAFQQAMTADDREENERLQTALRGIQSCSTCEACRGAATRALGGATPELRAHRIDRLGDCKDCTYPSVANVDPIVCTAQPPGVGQ